MFLFLIFCLFFLFLLVISRLLLLQLRVIRAFRSTLEDLSERRSMHSLHSLRSPRTANTSHGTGLYSVYTSNLLSPNYKNSTHMPQESNQQSQQSQNQSPLQPSVDMIYIDEDPTTLKYKKSNGNDASVAQQNDEGHSSSRYAVNKQKKNIFKPLAASSPSQPPTEQSETRI